MNAGFISTDRDHSTRLLLSFQIGIAIVFIVLLVSFWNFQIGQYTRFSDMAENNHQRTLALRAPRGVVFDRDGRVLVEHRYSLNISLVREQVEDLDESIRLLAAATGVDVHAVRGVVERNADVPEYRPIVIIRDASLGPGGGHRGAGVGAAGRRRGANSDAVLPHQCAGVASVRPCGRDHPSPVERGHRRAVAGRRYRWPVGHRAGVQPAPDG